MTVTTASKAITSGLPPTLRIAQAAMQLPEVQDMLRRLSAFELGIFMPHQHDQFTGEFLPLPADAMQVESGMTVSFPPRGEVANRTASFLPVGWRWSAGAPALAAACEMADANSPEDEADQAVKHNMPRDD